jgi:hypothetical protein
MRTRLHNAGVGTKSGDPAESTPKWPLCAPPDRGRSAACRAPSVDVVKSRTRVLSARDLDGGGRTAPGFQHARRALSESTSQKRTLQSPDRATRCVETPLLSTKLRAFAAAPRGAVRERDAVVSEQESLNENWAWMARVSARPPRRLSSPERGTLSNKMVVGTQGAVQICSRHSLAPSCTRRRCPSGARVHSRRHRPTSGRRCDRQIVLGKVAPRVLARRASCAGFGSSQELAVPNA